MNNTQLFQNPRRYHQTKSQVRPFVRYFLGSFNVVWVVSSRENANAIHLQTRVWRGGERVKGKNFILEGAIFFKPGWCVCKPAIPLQRWIHWWIHTWLGRIVWAQTRNIEIATCDGFAIGSFCLSLLSSNLQCSLAISQRRLQRLGTLSDEKGVLLPVVGCLTVNVLFRLIQAWSILEYLEL